MRESALAPTGYAVKITLELFKIVGVGITDSVFVIGITNCGPDPAAAVAEIGARARFRRVLALRSLSTAHRRHAVSMKRSAVRRGGVICNEGCDWTIF